MAHVAVIVKVPPLVPLPFVPLPFVPPPIGLPVFVAAPLGPWLEPPPLPEQAEATIAKHSSAAAKPAQGLPRKALATRIADLFNGRHPLLSR